MLRVCVVFFKKAYIYENEDFPVIENSCLHMMIHRHERTKKKYDKWEIHNFRFRDCCLVQRLFSPCSTLAPY